LLRMTYRVMGELSSTLYRGICFSELILLKESFTLPSRLVLQPVRTVTGALW